MGSAKENQMQIVSDEAVAAAEALRGANLQMRSEEWIRGRLAILLKSYKPRGISRDVDQVWYRARLSETEAGFARLSEVLHRPPAGTTFGRANLPGAPVFYGSWNMAITLDEIGAQVGDCVQIVWTRVQPGFQLPCLVVGEYQSMEFSGGSLINSRLLEKGISKHRQENLAEHLAMVYVDSVLAELFRRDATLPHEHKATAIFASHMHRAGGGLMYPSVRLPGGINIAVPIEPFDKQFEVIATEVHRIERCYGYGLYERKQLRFSCDFDSDGTIRWDSPKKPPAASWSLQEGVRAIEAFEGWRKVMPIPKAEETKKREDPE